MTIRRPYSLPNCTLILEGLSDAAAGQVDARPLMSILVNAECHFSGKEKPLTGGRDFFESLVTAASNYAQEFLSGVPHSYSLKDKPSLVQFQKIDAHLHRLMVESPGNSGDSTHRGASTTAQARQVDITTVQLFDLVEAVDQFLADGRTLPDIMLSIAPVPKRYAKAEVPVAQRAAPAAVGVTTLALAAIAFFMVPPPEVKRSEDPLLQPNSSSTTPASPVSSEQPTASPSPTTSSSVDAADLENLVTAAPEILDPTQLYFLQRKLQNNIYQKWTTRRQFRQDLVYRVGVGKDGAVVGYKPVNSAASDRLEETPLPELLYIPAAGSDITKEPLAQFRVVFTRRGVPQVSPWYGYKEKPSLGPEITDPTQIESLEARLSEQLKQNWQATPSFPRSLQYRVAVTKDGIVADYEPQNQPAFDYEDETPLPKLFQPSSSPDAVPQEPLAQFRVVFAPNGTIEVRSLQRN
ncbi:DUF4335 domain-containing protein [Coleofasciculus sp. FACHB-1120]|uniref:DUF4335 domain-containing protein n=1 Tax=Coleofasciculus sp. FACHB-1120 TaxID=2692783 RepID=UPI0016882C52|nr:DUF4335 domain-containing protein [Coleofasciculus sp. FACHB-1120]MBD2741410.1 DUF4335 domain-containing protein [Coleofasciculus sp. FACHB-1120]